jgi:hypothetical protein
MRMTHLAIAYDAAFRHGRVIITELPDALLRSPAAVRKRGNLCIVLVSEHDVRKDIQKLKVPNWKTLVHDRRRWKELVEKAKTLHKKL